jgi:hypothetical protein
VILPDGAGALGRLGRIVRHEGITIPDRTRELLAGVPDLMETVVRQPPRGSRPGAASSMLRA